MSCADWHYPPWWLCWSPKQILFPQIPKLRHSVLRTNCFIWRIHLVKFAGMLARPDINETFFHVSEIIHCLVYQAQSLPLYVLIVERQAISRTRYALSMAIGQHWPCTWRSRSRMKLFLHDTIQAIILTKNDVQVLRHCIRYRQACRC